jgi:fibronectin type 3 domain-containing protein
MKRDDKKRCLAPFWDIYKELYMKTKVFLTKAFMLIAALLVAVSISACAEMLEILLGGGEPTAPSGDDSGSAVSGLGTPTGVTAERNPAGSTDVRVSWVAVSGATGYRVYWSETYSGTGTLKGSPTTNSFTVTGNRTDATHYFRVTAVNSDGEGTASSWISVGPVSSTGGGTAGAPGAPTGVTAARNPAGSTDVRVSWNAVSGATSYRVYYSSNGTDSGTREGSPTTTSFTSTGNYTTSTHYFRVTAVNSAGEGAPSPWVSVGPVSGTGGGTATLPGTPTGVTAERNPAGSTDVRVSWNAVSGATGYRVYYSPTNSGNGDLEGEPTTTSFTSSNNRTNITHYFRVSAVNSAGEGTPSSWVSVGPVASTGGGTATLPGAPTGVTAARNPAGSTDVLVSWNAVSGATGYRVYWSETNSGSGKLEGSPTTTSFTSNNNRTDATHYFRVSTVNSAGEGTPSSWVSVGPVAATPTPTPTQSGGPTNWTKVSNSPFGNYILEAVAYGNNRFVAGSRGGRMAYSTDGVRWTAVSNSRFGDDSAINSIAYGGNRFVAVGDDGKMAYSSDGVTWTAVANSAIWNNTSDSGYTWAVHIYSIAYGNGRFVAAGMYGKIAYSTNGQSWTAVSNSRFGNSDIKAIAYGNNRFVAVGNDGKMAYSTDGQSWTAVSNSRFGASVINGIAYSGSRFVAVGSDGKMAYSTDGASWTAVSNSRFGDSDIYGIAYGTNAGGNGRFVAVGYGIMAYSTDGITWTAISNNPFGQYDDIYGIAYGNGRFVAVGWDGIAYADW